MSGTNVMKLRLEIMKQTGWGDDELDQKIEQKKSDLGFFVNEIAAIHIIAKDVGASDGQIAITQTPLERARASLLKQVKDLNDDSLNGLYEKFSEQNVYFKNNPLLCYQMIARYYGKTLEYEEPTYSHVDTIESIFKEGDGETFRIKGIVIQQRAQKNKQGDLVGVYKTEIIDETTNLVLTSWDKENQFGQYHLPWGKSFVFEGVKKSVADDPKYDDTYWWGGRAHRIDPIDNPYFRLWESLDDKGYETVILKGVITNVETTDEQAARCGSCDVVKTTRAKNPNINCSCGNDLDYHPIDRFYMYESGGTTIKCRTRGIDLRKEISNENGLSPYTTGIEGWEIMVFGQKYSAIYGEPTFVVYGILSARKDTQLKDMIGNTLDKFMGKKQKYEFKDKEWGTDNPATIRVDKKVDDQPKLEYGDTSVLQWYDAIIQKHPVAIPFDQFKGLLEETFVATTDKHVHQIINNLIDEGLIKSYIGAMVEPNV